MDTPFSLPPWLSPLAFAAPVVTFPPVASSVPPSLIAPANPNRALLLIAADFQGAAVAIAPSNKIGGGPGFTQAGIVLAAGAVAGSAIMSFPYIFIDGSWGPMLGMEWYGFAFSGSNTNIMVVETIANSWPSSVDDVLDHKSILPTPLFAPPPPLTTAPGRPGAWNPIQYWKQSIAKLFSNRSK